ncbi:YxeA family protein [Margalitia sp. FSL K6-0131]|uniref:YxeA family protein n=1 Tax=Margalitia sp. FSL K6-0131 TaxID=2954604 RepID=UPI0030FB9074
MKKLLLGVIVLIIIGAGISTYIGKEYRDRFNPLVKEKDVYALLQGEGKPNPDFPQRYMFMLNGVDELGKEDEIKVTTSEKDFPKNTFIKVHVKGKYVFEYEIVKEKDVPEKAKEKLQKQK